MELIEDSKIVDGVRVHFRTVGSGPALIMLHGLVGSGRNWSKNVQYLAQFRTVYALDLANCGVSERVAGMDASLEAHADRVARFMDEMGLERADLVGHSHGAATAMMISARYPERVVSLVLFAPANPFCTLGHKQMRFYATPLGSVFAQWVIPKMPRIMHRRSLERMYADPKLVGEGELDGYTATLDRLGISHVLKIMLGWRRDMAHLAAALPAVARFRTLVVWGDQDRAVAVESGRELARQLGARLEVIPATGHIVFEEKPEICNPLLGEWLLA